MDNSLANRCPDLICEWSDKNPPLTAKDVTYGSNKVYWWKGKCGHEWQASVKARSSGENCPICSGARVIEGINDLATLKPELAQEWSEKNKIKPTEVSVGSHKKVLWKCMHDHEWEASVKSRTANGTGCPYCSHNMILPGFNDLEALFPQVAQEWSKRNLPLLPSQVTAYSNKKVWWECEHGHEWQALISTRSYGSKCPFCTGIILLPGFNDLAATNPEVAREWSDRNLPLKAEMINAKSTKNAWWKCATCGYEWKAVVKARVNGQQCPVCADRTVLTGYNDLATTDKEIIKEWDYERNSLHPTKVSRKSHERAWWKCKYGHSYNAKICERTIEGMNCKVCEVEFDSALLQLLVSLYASKYSLKTVTMSDEIIGLTIETYIPELSVIIELWDKLPGGENRRTVKKHLCKMNGITYFEIDAKNRVELAGKIKQVFHSKHIFIDSVCEKDIVMCKAAFYKWKELNY